MSAKYEVMCNLLKQFDNGWEDNFKQSINLRDDKNKIISASDSLVTNRHSFAHGNNPSATFDEIFEYYKDVLELINIFDSIVA